MSARDRVLDAAAELFYALGINSVGVDRIIAEAGVAKATFYRHFPSKDELIVAWLERPSSRWFETAMAYAESTTSDPVARVHAFFDWICAWRSDPAFRGCAYVNTAIELPDARHRARQVVVDAQIEVEQFFADALEAAGCPEPRHVAAELFILVPGALVSGVARGDGPVRAARDAAASLIAAALEE